MKYTVFLEKELLLELELYDEFLGTCSTSFFNSPKIMGFMTQLFWKSFLPINGTFTTLQLQMSLKILPNLTLWIHSEFQNVLF